MATTAATAAADVIRGASRDFSTTLKGVVDPVTEVDLAAERAILDVLGRERPDDSILSEEAGGSVGTRTWVIDPLDGTVNFVQRIEHVAVSVGLWLDDHPVVGVIVDVWRHRIYRAVRGAGAEVDGAALSVSEALPADAVVGTGFPYDRVERADAYGDLVGGLLGRFRGVRRFGAAALDFAWVAEGRLGGYGEVGLAPWDVAAGILLVREAGGVVLDESGRDATLSSRAFAAGNEPVAGALARVLSAVVG